MSPKVWPTCGSDPDPGALKGDDPEPPQTPPSGAYPVTRIRRLGPIHATPGGLV